MNRSLNEIILLFTLLAGTTVSCGLLAQVSTAPSLPFEILSFPTADYYGLVMVHREVIALVKNWNGYNLPLQYARLGEAALQEIRFPNDSTCIHLLNNNVFDTLPDGRLQLLEKCNGGDAPTALNSLRAYDLLSGEIEEVATSLPLDTGEVSWNPDETRGVGYLWDGYSRSALFWLWKDGFGPMDLVVTDQGKSWNLKNFYPNFPDAVTLQTGNAGPAAWSPDGHSIVFYGSPDAISETASARFDVAYKLYLMDATQLHPHAVASNIYFPNRIKWSPNSKYVAFIGQYGFAREDGVWLYSDSARFFL